MVRGQPSYIRPASTTFLDNPKNVAPCLAPVLAHAKDQITIFLHSSHSSLREEENEAAFIISGVKEDIDHITVNNLMTILRLITRIRQSPR